MFENVYRHHKTLKMDKIYFCMMKRLGPKLFMYGERTDDYNIETLFRNSEETQELIKAIDNRQLDHECELCKEYGLSKLIKQSGSVDHECELCKEYGLSKLIKQSGSVDHVRFI